MNGFKGILQSKTVWGGIIVLASWGLATAGYVISESDQKTLVEIVAGIASSEGGVTAVIMAAVNATGALWAIYGRVTATKRIK